MPHPALLLLLVAVLSNSLTLADEAASPPWETGRLTPQWADVPAQRTLTLTHDGTRSDEDNGRVLALMLRDLQPGDRLQIGPGRYSIAAKIQLDLSATAAAPVWIEAADPQQQPVITRPDARQNVLNLGESSPTQYVCLRNLEITGGSTLIRLHDCRRVWLDRCHLHHAGAEGVTANTRNTSHLFITGCHLHHFTQPEATGEALYLGANHGKAVMAWSVIADNHIHDCGGRQGDGIEVKQGSHHNWIVGNHVHDTNYPCIIVYGTGGQGRNMIERNLCYRSHDNVLQVQGEAIVRNNLLMAGRGAGFTSTDHQGKTSHLTFVHNTIISERRGANLTSWNDRPGLLFANNAVYTNGGEALRFPGGSRGVVVAGNVVVGQVQGAAGGWSDGNGPADFVNVSWDAEQRMAAPAERSALRGAADPRFAVERDATGNRRGDSRTAGACDAPR